MIKLLPSILQALVHRKKLSSAATSCINLIGRSYLEPKNFTTEEMKSVLWTAYDLKQILLSKCCDVHHIKSARITLLMQEPSMEIQASASSAAHLLHSHLNIIVNPTWDTEEFVDDTGKFLSTCSDMIFCQSKYQSKIEKLAKGSTIPVVCIRSCTYATLDTLADLLTLQERYGCLKNLNVGWIGTPCPLINTYLCITPKFGINVRYCCACAPGTGMCPATLPLGRAVSRKTHTVLQECENATTAIEKVHVIITAKHGVAEFSVSLKHISEKADEHWSFLHKLPRGSVEVQSEVFNHKNSLVWRAKGNLQWIYAALMVRLLSQYEHVSEMPKFGDDIKCTK